MPTPADEGIPRPATVSPRVRSAAVALAGPLAIGASVLIVLHDFVLRSVVWRGDVYSFWLPVHCYLGRSLAAGHIPAWNPSYLAGAPFAADPQSGWMYVPVMALYSSLPCDVAVRWLIVLQPIIAGLATYWFLRDQGLSRPAATTGGLLLSMTVAGSRTVVSLPFSGPIAWSAVLLACASRYVGAGSWSSRLGWCLVTGLAWGQLAGAHLSNGLILGTGLLTAYLLARVIREVRTGHRDGSEALLLGGVLLVSMVLVNTALFLPRLAYLPGTTFRLGYDGLAELSGQLSGQSIPFRAGAGTDVGWPLTLAASPGAYLGAVALALAFAGWWLRRFRHILLGFGLFGGVCYVLSLDVVARNTAGVALSLPFGDFYVHEPDRFVSGVMLALALLAPFGIQAWSETSSVRRRLLMVTPGVVLWGALPLLLGTDLGALRLLALGALAGGSALALASRRPALMGLVVSLLAIELVANGLLGLRSSGAPATVAGASRPERLLPSRTPDLDVADYVRPDAIARGLRSATGLRYIRLNAPAQRSDRWSAQSVMLWGPFPNNRSLLFSLDAADGYNPVQPLRYWAFVRATEERNIPYNWSSLRTSNRVALDLLQVGFVVSPSGRSGAPGALVTRNGAWALYRLPSLPSRASVITSWRVVTTPAQALEAVRAPFFDAAASVVLERQPALSPVPAAAPGRATYRWLGDQAAEIQVDAPAPAIVLVRNSWDRGWHASVDGVEAPVLRADFAFQGIPVPAGRHVIGLHYDDPWIGYGLVGSTLSIAFLAGGALWFRRREGRP